MGEKDECRRKENIDEKVCIKGFDISYDQKEITIELVLLDVPDISLICLQMMSAMIK